jgi:hypothetical protein
MVDNGSTPGKSAQAHFLAGRGLLMVEDLVVAAEVTNGVRTCCDMDRKSMFVEG